MAGRYLRTGKILTVHISASSSFTLENTQGSSSTKKGKERGGRGGELVLIDHLPDASYTVGYFLYAIKIHLMTTL